MGEGDQVREHQARVIPPRTCHEFRSANGGNKLAPANGGNHRRDSDEPITSGYVRS